MQIDKKQIIDEIVDRTHISKSLVEVVYSALELELKEMISLTGIDNEKVKIDLFDGVNLNCKYVPDRMFKSNLPSVGNVKTASKIKITASFADDYVKIPDRYAI